MSKPSAMANSPRWLQHRPHRWRERRQNGHRRHPAQHRRRRRPARRRSPRHPMQGQISLRRSGEGNAMTICKPARVLQDVLPILDRQVCRPPRRPVARVAADALGESLTPRQPAAHVIAAYWPQLRPHQNRVLSQSCGHQDTVLAAVQGFRNAGPEPLVRARTLPSWSGAVWPGRRNGLPVNFDNRILLVPGVADTLVGLAGAPRAILQQQWAQKSHQVQRVARGQLP